MKRKLLAAIAALLALALFAGPAVANDTGTGSGNAVVGKTKYTRTATNTCAGDPAGGGLGLPGVGANGKKAYYRIVGTISSATKGTGDLLACGQLDPELGTAMTPGLGAACGASSSNNGHGWIDYHTGPNLVQLTDLGWDASVTTFTVTGNAYDHGKNGKNGTIVAIVQASGGLACANKTDNKADGPGATGFVVNIVYQTTSTKNPALKHTKPKDSGKSKYTNPKA